MEKQISLPFNPEEPTVIHLDLNSCFATIEQQANPKIRGKPVAVAAYTTPSGCIIAPSVEAKRAGVKLGLRVRDGKIICPQLIVLPPDPWKYRNVNQAIRRILDDYSGNVVPRSIDEFVLDLKDCPTLTRGIVSLGKEIKKRIKQEAGDWLTVSLGIGPNRFLAKTASSLHKPDGLEVIDKHNFLQVYRKLQLMDLYGIKIQNTIRLNNLGIYQVMDFYQAPVWKLKAAFQSILGYYWYLRLRGWEIDDVEFTRKSFGNSYALPKPLVIPQQLAPILRKLVEKTGRRMRYAGYKARGIHLAVLYRDFDFWHKGLTLPDSLFDSNDIYRAAYKLLLTSGCHKSVRTLAFSCFRLQSIASVQMSLLDDLVKKENLVAAVDQINQKWGDFTVTPALMIGMEDVIIDRISYGGIKELQEIPLF